MAAPLCAVSVLVTTTALQAIDGPDGLGTFELGTREARQITLPPCNGQFRYGVCNCNPGWSGELCGIECNNRGTIANSSTLGNVSLKHTNCECDPGWGGAPVFFEGGPARPNGRRWRGSVQCFFDRQTGCFGRGDIYSRPPYCRNCSAGEPDSCKCDDFRTGHMCDELDKAKAAGALRKKQEEHLYYWIIWFVVTGAMFCGCSCFGMCCRREVDYNPLKRFLVAQFVGMDMWSDLGFVAISLQSELFKYQFQGDYHVLLILAIAAVAVAFIAWMVTFLFEMCDPTFQMGRAFPPLPREGSIRHIVATGILFVVEDLVQFALQLLYFSTVGIGGDWVAIIALIFTVLSMSYTVWYLANALKCPRGEAYGDCIEVKLPPPNAEGAVPESAQMQFNPAYTPASVGFSFESGEKAYRDLTL